MKNCIKLFCLVMVLTVVFSNLAFAATFSDVTGDVPQINSEEVENVIIESGEQVSNWAVVVMGVVSNVSLPICALLCLWGAILYFILGIRNLYKKRQGMLLMWGALTFLVIAKIAYFLVWFFTKVA